MDEANLLDTMNKIEATTGIAFDVSKIAKEDYPQIVKMLVSQGKQKTKIAKFLGISRRSVYNYLNDARNELREELENQKYLDVFVDQLDDLLGRRDSLLRDAQRISVSGSRVAYDADGSEIDRTGSTRDYTEIMRLVRDYDKMIIDLKKAVGIIPVNSPDRIYSSVSENNPDNAQTQENAVFEMNSAELQQALLTKLQNKAPVLGQSTLKSVKDTSIL